MSRGPRPLAPGSRRIAMVLANMSGGGAERVALTLIQHFIAKGHSVDLILAEAKGELLPLVPPAARVIDLKATRIRGALSGLWQYFRREKPDAVQISMWPLTIVGILAHRLAASPARLMVSDHVAYSQPFLSEREQRLLRWTTRLFYPLADFRVVVSARGADDLAAISGIPRDRFDVIYNPIAPPAAIRTNTSVEQLWGPEGSRIISVGSLKEQKNHALLLRAFANVRDTKAKLMILGEGHLRNDLEQLATELGIAGRLLMPGFTTDAWPYLASADLFALSSDYEGFPLVLPEAMYAGLPIVSTDCVSGPSELLDGGRFGRLVPCGDAKAMTDAIDEAISRPKEPEKVRQRAAQLTGANVFARYTELLTS